MAITFQVPMQYCSLQHWTFLQSPVISTAGCCFCFGSIPSFFLELFLHWSPVAYSAVTDLGSSFSILSVFLPWEHQEEYEKEKYRTLKDELPRWGNAQYATGDQWRNNSRKNEAMEPKQKQHPVVDVTGDWSKVWCCTEQYCIGTWNVRSMNLGKLEVVNRRWQEWCQHFRNQRTKMDWNGGN